jgi:membrane dipeptidase
MNKTSASIRLIALASITLVAAIPALAATPADNSPGARIDRILASTPLIDGHNDLPWELRTRFNSDVGAIDLSVNQAGRPYPGGAPLMTDMPRLHAGRVGGQFWSVWIPVDVKGYEAVQMTLEEIDIVKRLVERYPSDLELALSAPDIRRIHKAHRIASLIGVEGGHQINGSLAVLRQYYAAGARYMTLTHTANTPWADAATDNPQHHGLSPFGVEVVREMNRIGMLVDLSHVSPEAMKVALATTEAPVIYSHSSARAITDHPRNVPDDVLRLVAANGGVVMVNFYTAYVSQARATWEADREAEKARFNSPPYGGLYIGQPERAAAALARWDEAHPKPAVVLSEVADHIEHVRKIAGIDHVGLGSDFDGIEEAPAGLEGVDRFPALLAELMRRGWSDADIAKLAGENLLRVLGEAEAVAARLRQRRAASIATLGDSDR